MATHKQSHFLKFIVGAVGIMSFGFYLFQQGINKKEDFNKAMGQIVYYSASYLDLPYERVKYLKINNYPKVFQLWMPAPNDNKSFLFKFDELNLGDTIDIYFSENKFEADQRVNREMRYIDKNKMPVYISARNDKIPGLVFLGIGFAILISLIILKQKGKIN